MSFILAVGLVCEFNVCSCLKSRSILPLLAHSLALAFIYSSPSVISWKSNDPTSCYSATKSNHAEEM